MRLFFAFLVLPSSASQYPWHQVDKSVIFWSMTWSRSEVDERNTFSNTNTHRLTHKEIGTQPHLFTHLPSLWKLHFAQQSLF